MELTTEELKIAKDALEVSAWQIFTKTWKKRIQETLDALRAGEAPPAADLDFALTVTYEGRTNYAGKVHAGPSWDAMLACLPVRDKVRKLVAA